MLARQPARLGFTLVEALLVAVVLAIAALLAAPMMGATSGARLSSAGRMLIADLALAQMESISHPDDPYGLRFDTVTATYTVVHDATYPPFDCTAATAVTDPVTRQSYVTQFGAGRGSQLSGVSIQSGYSLDGDACISFGAFGQTDQTSTATVTLASGSATLTISIDPVTGEATSP